MPININLRIQSAMLTCKKKRQKLEISNKSKFTGYNMKKIMWILGKKIYMRNNSAIFKTLHYTYDVFCDIKLLQQQKYCNEIEAEFINDLRSSTDRVRWTAVLERNWMKRENCHMQSEMTPRGVVVIGWIVLVFFVRKINNIKFLLVIQ